MVNEILKILSDNYCKKIVISKDIYEQIKSDEIKNIESNYQIETIDDIRSATFFAFGEAQITNESICLLINGEYLPNIYTGITEAWFQKKNIIVIALYNDFDRINSEYLRRCVPNIITIYDNDIRKYKEKIESAIQEKYPCLINVKDNDYTETKVDYTNLCLKLSKILNKGEEVLLYNMTDMKSEIDLTINNISENHKYGILSKYMGYILGKNKKVVLCAPSEILKLDLNIFNNRYINENFKIIFINNKDTFNGQNIEEWIKNNEINVNFVNEPAEKELEKFVKSNKPEVMFIGGK